MTSHRMFLALGSLCVLTGCVGPKFMSNSDGKHEAMRPIPKGQHVIITPFDDAGETEKIDNQSMGTYFAGALAQKLLALNSFRQVTVSASRTDSTAIVIAGSVSSFGSGGWGKRAIVGNAQSNFEATGEIRDRNNNKLLSFTKSRSAEGGLMGAGGWFTAGGGQMKKQLADWVAADVVKVIKKEAK